MLGAVMIGTLEQSLIRMPNISEFWKDALQGLFILLAVASDAIILSRLRTFWARGEMKLVSTSTTSTPSSTPVPNQGETRHVS